MEACETPDVVAGRQTQILRESGDPSTSALLPRVSRIKPFKSLFLEVYVCVWVWSCVGLYLRRPEEDTGFPWSRRYKPL